MSLIKIRQLIKFLLFIVAKINFYTKKILPNTLFYRIFIILASLVFILQILIIVIFYDHYWRSINNKILGVTAISISNLLNTYNQANTEEELKKLIEESNKYSNIYVTLQSNSPRITFKLNTVRSNQELLNTIQSNLNYNTEIYIIEYNQGLITKIYATSKFNSFIELNLNQTIFFSNSLNVLIMITLLFYILTLLIAWQFFRLQTRPLKILSKMAKNFAKNKKAKYIIPSGALEIRQTTIAFNEMFNQIEGFIEQRTMMLSSISHDLKTSLTKINLLVELSSDDEMKSALMEELKHMQSMIHSYLDFAKGNYTSHNPEPINIENFFNDLKKIYSNQNFIVNVEYLQSSPYFYGSYNDLQRCFDNLLDNSIKYSSEVNIKITNNSNHSLLINFTDNGEGIDETDFTNIFKPFYKTNKARTADKRNFGVGLGLYNVKELINKNQGTIYLSKPKKKGININIILPINHD